MVAGVLQPVILQGLPLPEVFSLEGTRERGNRDPLDFKGSSPRDFRKLKGRNVDEMREGVGGKIGTWGRDL